MVILIDAGHGIDTKGKQSPKLDQSMDVWDIFTENGRFKEWKFARVVAHDIVEKLKSYGYDARILVEEEKDISLKHRVDRVNKVCAKEGSKNVILVSVHANAVGDSSKWMTGRGWEAYTTKGTTKSDKLAECLYKRAEKNFNGQKIRKDTTDGDSDKEANFYIILNANCPAVLTENFFYDNKEDLAYMTSDEGLHAIERTHVEGIIDYIKQL
jgi:N-acetylmuramoyl-L-alanine amidase